MKIQQFLYLLLLTSLFYGCGQQDGEFIDLNNDGVADVYYEYEDDGYYELMDRNFDGRIDQMSRYSLEHYLESAKSDDDFDGFLETKIIYKDSLMAAVLVDTDNNQLVDVFLIYENDLIKSGEKYYKQDGNDYTPNIGKIEYEFGYPSGKENLVTTNLTEKDFHNNVNLLLPD